MYFSITFVVDTTYDVNVLLHLRPSISVNGEIAKILNIPIGNLGSVFDPSMNMAAHVSKAVKSANYHLRNIGRIRKYLTAESTKGAVISLVTSRFDYCNGLLCGIPEELICKLERIQNNAARVITLTKKYDHFTPVLKELHWLPVRKRIEFKILLLAYKCLHGTAPSYLREMLNRVCPTTDTEINIQELTLRAENQHENLTVTDHLVPVPQNYGISSQIIFGQLGVWQSSNDNWKHICSKMYLSNNYVDINIYPLTMNVNAPLSMFIWKGRNIKWQYYYYYYYCIWCFVWCWSTVESITSDNSFQNTFI